MRSSPQPVPQKLTDHLQADAAAGGERSVRIVQTNAGGVAAEIRIDALSPPRHIATGALTMPEYQFRPPLP